MKAMVLIHPGSGALELQERPLPEPREGQLRVRVRACGVCRTDLHVVDNELPDLRPPLIPGHEIVGTVDALGPNVHGPKHGQRVGIPWLGFTCGDCAFCRSGRENLCPNARFTGYQLDGGYAEYALADARFVFPLPDRYSDLEAAPLLCAGLIGYRAYRLAGEGKRLGLYGFGAAAHILAQVATQQGRHVYAFTSPGDHETQAFARKLGAVWAGGSSEPPPEPLDAAILFAPVGRLIPEALQRVAPGGVVVAAGIHMSDIPSFPYRLLWEERQVRSVANLTREDARQFLQLAAALPIQTQVTPYALEDANRALEDLRHGRFDGAAVLVPNSGPTAAAPR